MKKVQAYYMRCTMYPRIGTIKFWTVRLCLIFFMKIRVSGIFLTKFVNIFRSKIINYPQEEI